MYRLRWIVGMVLALGGFSMGVVGYLSMPERGLILAGSGIGLIFVSMFIPPIGGLRPEFRLFGVILIAICLGRAISAGWAVMH